MTLMSGEVNDINKRSGEFRMSIQRIQSVIRKINHNDEMRVDISEIHITPKPRHLT